MDIKKVKITNFLTIGHAELELDTRGLLLVQGVNSDDSSAKSNGAGKSSLLDSITWAIYGQTARGETGDSVVNRIAKKNCSVCVEIEEGGAVYRIVRHRKHADHKNAVLVEQVLPTPATLTKGTDKETQEVINGIVGCSLDVFMASVYCGQEKMVDLPALTDKNLKLLIEEAAGVEVLAAAYTEARDRHNKCRTTLDAVTAAVASLKARRTAMDADLTQLNARHADFETERKPRAAKWLTGIKALDAQIADLTKELAAIDVPALRDEATKCKTRLDARKGQDNELAKLLGALRQEELKIARLTSDAGHGKRMLEQMQAKLTGIDEQVGKPCGECGKPYCEHDLDSAKAAQKAAIDNKKDALRPLIAEMKAAKEAVTAAQKAVADFEATMTDVTAVANRMSEINAKLNLADKHGAAIKAAQDEIARAKDKAKQDLTTVNPWATAVQVKKDELEKNAKETADKEGEVGKLEEECALLADAVRVFGPTGVRAHVLDTVTPFLNARTSDYLGALADGNIHAVWSTLSKTAKGDLKEKFNIEVTNDEGADSFGGLSGGEKRKVRLATAMALQDLVATRASKPLNLFMADEIDHALDDAGLERLMTVLDRKAKERGTVVVVSHQSLTDWIDNVITVEKKGKQSTVSGATHRGF